MILDLPEDPCSRSLRSAADRRGGRRAGVLLAVLVARLVPRPAPARLRPRRSERDGVRLVVAPPAGLDPRPELAVELIRALHPRQRRGFDAWRVGWPASELRVVWRDGELAWEIETNRQVAALATAQLRALYPGVAIEPSRVATISRRSRSAVGRLGRSGRAGRCGEVDAPEARVLRALAGGARACAPAAAEVRLRLHGRPVPPERWRRAWSPTPRTRARSIVGPRRTRRSSTPSCSARPRASPPRRRSGCPPARARRQARKRRGVVGFDVGLRSRSPGSPTPPRRRSCGAWSTSRDELDDGRQAIRWADPPGAAPSRRGAPARRLGARPAVVPARRVLRSGRVRPRAPARRRAAGQPWPGSVPRHRREPRARWPAGRRPRPPPRGLRLDRLGQEHAPAQPRAGASRHRRSGRPSSIPMAT